LCGAAGLRVHLWACAALTKLKPEGEEA
jgi:hypothetical protein